MNNLYSGCNFNLPTLSYAVIGSNSDSTNALLISLKFLSNAIEDKEVGPSSRKKSLEIEISTFFLTMLDGSRSSRPSEFEMQDQPASETVCERSTFSYNQSISWHTTFQRNVIIIHKLNDLVSVKNFPMKTIVLLSWFAKCSILLISFHKHEVLCQSCLGSQQSLMRQLKDSLKFNHEKSIKLTKWKESIDCCSWDGVICEDGCVTELDLSLEGITGGIDNSSSLFKLQNLKRLDLSFNYFNTTIPRRIGSLKNLSYLNLSNAGFGGQVPEELSKLSNLVRLDLSTQSLSQISSVELRNPNLSILIQDLSKLEELYLDGVKISAHGSEWGQVLSSSLPRLRVLSMTNCHLSGPIDSSLEKLRSLSVIRLDNNNLSSPVPGFFSSFSNLSSLHLSSCGLSGVFPREIFLVPTLQVIDVSDNLLLQGSLPEFQSNSSLQQLFLDSTNFSGSLPSSMGNLENLSTLKLLDCQFSGTLPNSMAQLSQLVSVDLSYNNFSGQIPSFQNSKSLTRLILYENSLTGSISSVRWEVLNKLVVIDLRSNTLNGSIPASLFKLPSLELLLLSYNQFEGRLPELQLASSSLLELDLGSNKLQGPIPLSIFSLRSLRTLAISSNNLNGTVQLDHFQGIRNLTILDLSYNNLSVVEGSNGSTWSSSELSILSLVSCKLNRFPNLKNHPKLAALDLSSNQIHGEIPNWIWELASGYVAHINLSCNSLVSLQEPYTLPSYLNVLDLHSNQIGGRIPVLPLYASYIDFSRNNFNSSIPPDFFENRSFAVFLFLSNNNLTGVVPGSICDASNIQVLDLSNNRLSGSIPSCMPAMSQTLRILNLHGNHHFAGPIPDSFPANCSLKTLDLNGNLIQGQIPKSLVNCTELEVLNLGNNNLSDKFPCMLSSIPNLKVLVLRSNNFIGRIGCDHTNGTWKKLQILDLAHNSFGGEIPGKSLTTWQAMLDASGGVSQGSHIQFEMLRYTKLFYQDSVNITYKGRDMELVKILTVFTCIDLSSNNFVGQIPEEVSLLGALYVLNLSHNALTGQIPSSIGNLSQLESLDLAWNNLSGSIPTSIGNLNFLSFLNLSFNHLVGQIPCGSQIQTFSEDSFTGNEGLCGFPLTVNCVGSDIPTKDDQDLSHSAINWDIIAATTGFVVGLGSVICSLMFCRRFSSWYFHTADDIVFRTFPRIYQWWLN